MQCELLDCCPAPHRTWGEGLILAASEEHVAAVAGRLHALGAQPLQLSAARRVGRGRQQQSEGKGGFPATPASLLLRHDCHRRPLLLAPWMAGRQPFQAGNQAGV